MYYALKSHDINAKTVSTIMRLFRHHQKCHEQLQVSQQNDIFTGKHFHELSCSLFRKRLRPQRKQLGRKLTVTIYQAIYVLLLKLQL